MGDERRDDQPTEPGARRSHPARDEVATRGGLAEADDTTEADQGMTAGTGATPNEGATQPLGTEPLTDETEQEEGEGS